MDIRNEIITGSFMIDPRGRKEPIDWKNYALKLEKYIDQKLLEQSTDNKASKPND